MKQRLHTHLIAVVLLLALLTGCNKQQVQDLSKPGQKGTVTSKYQHRNLDGTLIELAPIMSFDEVVNAGNLKVIIVPDDVYAVGVAASAYDENLLNITVTDGVLNVAYTDESAIDNENNIVYVHTPTVDKITMDSKGNIETAGWFSTVNVDMRGKGTLLMTGATHTLNINCISGTGKVEALGMPAIDVVVTGKSNGIIKVAPITSLRVDVRGSASIYYTGNPQVTSNLRGGAKLIHQ